MAKQLLSTEELDELIKNVSFELKDLLKSEEALVKADPGQVTPGEAQPTGSSTQKKPSVDESSPEESSSGSSSEDSSVPPIGAGAAPSDQSASAPGSPPGSPSPSAPPGAPPAPDASATPAPGQPGMDPAASAPQATPESLKAEYDQLSPDEKKMHFLALKASLMADMQQPDASAPPAATPSPAAQASPGMEMTQSPDMGKGEVLANPANGDKLTKSESDFETLKKTIEDQAKTIELLNASIGKIATNVKRYVEKPIIKAVTNFNDVKFDSNKSGEKATNLELVKSMSKDQVKSELSKKIRQGNLKKSDQDAIIAYTSGQVGVEGVAHLLIIESK